MQKEPTKKAAGKRNAGANPPRKLSRAEKKQIAEVIRQAKGDGKAHTAQQTIPYLTMYPDGICKVSEKKYSKSIAFEDINYQLAQADDKTAIFENWCDFLNYFDASVSVQLSFINQGTQREQAEKAINIPAQDDAFNSIRTEYSDMLKNQLSKGNNGLVKHKYITFSIEADNPAAAKARLSRIETDVLNNFKVLGASARPMTGYERLNVLHGVFHPEGKPFSFDFSWLAPSGLSTKDFIAPSSFHFGEGRYFRMGRKIGAVSFLEILAPELNDRMLADILDLETGVIVNLHIRSIDQTEAIKTIKRKITDLDKMKIEEQKKAVRSGYDMDIIPSDLATFGSEAKNLLQDLQSRNERMFLLTFLVVNMADTKRKLENDIFAAAGIAQKYNCALTRLDYQQEAGLKEQTAGQEQPEQEAEKAAEPDKDTFSIYQLKRGDETRDFRFEPYDRLQAAGLSVEAANYDLIYTAPLTPDMTLESIWEKFNIDHPKDFKGHSLSVSDVVVLHQNGQDTAHYVDSFGYKNVPEFLQEQKQLTPDELETGETIKTPRGTFYVTDMSHEQMEAAGYGFHHQSDDGKYFIMGNGTRAFAIAAEPPENYLKTAEQTTEQNYNMIDGQINNTPTVDELEAKVKAGETISLVDLANAVKADKERGKAKPEKKPSIRAQLLADKEKAQKKPAKQKSQDLERS